MGPSRLSDDQDAGQNKETMIDAEKGPLPQETDDSEDLIVDWAKNDLDNPLNWSSGKKTLNLILLSSLTFVTPLASSMFAPGVPGVLREFGSSSVILAAFVVSIYLIGYWVYQVSNVLFVGFTIGCALAPTLGNLIGFRFLAGSAGSAPLVLGSGSIADMYPREKRGSKMSLFSLGPLLGPVIGPVAGAFLAQDVGWRWVFWVITIAAGIVTILCLIFMSETYSPVLLERKAARVRKETGNSDYRSKLATEGSVGSALQKALVRPLKMLFRSPVVFCFVLYVSVIYGYLYLLFTTITEVYEQEYGFSTGTAGLSYIGIGIGMFVGIGIFGASSDKIFRKAQQKLGEDAQVPPEIRLKGLIAPAFCIPIGLFWYGWSAQNRIHWIMPIIGTGWVGLGLIGIFLAVQTYLVDSYPQYAASVTAANTILRSLVGAFLPLAGQPLYEKLGLGWGNSVLGFIALAMVPLPLLFLKYGAWLRTNPKFKVDF